LLLRVARRTSGFVLSFADDCGGGCVSPLDSFAFGYGERYDMMKVVRLSERSLKGTHPKKILRRSDFGMICHPQMNMARKRRPDDELFQLQDGCVAVIVVVAAAVHEKDLFRTCFYLEDDDYGLRDDFLAFGSYEGGKESESATETDLT
jgi:hypothetical protein